MAKKTGAKPLGDQVPAERPKRGKGSGKPNRAMRAKAAGIDTHLTPEPGEEPIVIVLDHEGTIEPALGRPTALTPDLGGRICSLVAQGYSFEEIEDVEGMPTERTIFRWMAASGEGPNGKLYDAFRHSLARARTLRAAARASRLERLSRRLTAPKPGELPLDAASARVAKEIHEFLMSVEDPGQFGKKLMLQGDKAKPLIVENRHSLSDAMLEAIAQGKDIDSAE